MGFRFQRRPNTANFPAAGTWLDRILEPALPWMGYRTDRTSPSSRDHKFHSRTLEEEVVATGEVATGEAAMAVAVVTAAAMAVVVVTAAVPQEKESSTLSTTRLHGDP